MNLLNPLRHAAILGGLLISACQSPQPKIDSNRALLDGDIIVMEGRGGLAGKQGTLSLMGIQPMTFEELSHCADNIVDSNHRQKQLDSANRQLFAQQAELDRQTKALDAERAVVDVHSASQVNAYNKRVEQNRVSISQFNSNVATYNAKANQLNGMINQFNAACANRGYRRSDYARLSEQLRLAIQTRSEATDIPLIEGAGDTPSQSKP